MMRTLLILLLAASLHAQSGPYQGLWTTLDFDTMTYRWVKLRPGLAITKADGALWLEPTGLADLQKEIMDLTKQVAALEARITALEAGQPPVPVSALEAGPGIVLTPTPSATRISVDFGPPGFSTYEARIEEIPSGYNEWGVVGFDFGETTDGWRSLGGFACGEACTVTGFYDPQHRLTTFCQHSDCGRGKPGYFSAALTNRQMVALYGR